MLHALVCMSSLCLHALCNLHVSFSPYFSPKVLEVGPASFLQIHALARDLTRGRPSLGDSLASAKLRLSQARERPIIESYQTTPTQCCDIALAFN